MNAVIKYLAQIAEALEGMAKGSAGRSKAKASSASSSSQSSSSVNVIGSVDTEAINETLETALIVTTEEEGEQEGETIETQTSVYNIIAAEIGAVIHDAFHITVSETQDEQTVQVEKPVLDVIRQDLYDMRNSEALPDENNGD